MHQLFSIRVRHASGCGLLAAALLALALVSAASDVRAGGEGAARLDVRAVKAVSRTVQLPIVGTGTIVADKTSRIGPLVEGQVANVMVRIGDRVKKGAPLFQIRPDSYRFAYETAKSSLDVAEAQAIDARPAFERTKKLYSQGTASQSSYDTARGALAVVEARITSAKVAADQAKHDLDDTVAYAPFDSVVTARLADEGVYLSNRVPGGNSAIVELQKIDVVTAVVQVPARELEKLRAGAPVTLHIDGLTEPRWAAITVINDRVDVATRSLELRVNIGNGDYAVKPGLFVRAEILPASREAVVIPRETVTGVTGAAHVFVLDNGKAVRRPVDVVDFDAEQVEVMSGLKPGERILSGPDLGKLSDGVTVGEVADVAG